MASVHQRPGTKFLHAAWRDANGRLHLQSTKQTDRKLALAFALEIERAERMAGGETLTESAARGILNGILERTASGESLRVPSVETFLLDWLRAKEAVKADTTGERYAGVVEDFLAHLGNRVGRPLNALTARDIQNFLTKRQKSGVSPSTVALEGKILRTAFNLARRQGIIATNPAEAVELPVARHVERGTFTPTEVKMLVEAAEGEWSTLILVAYYSGQRLRDCCALEWAAVDFTNGTISFEQRKTGTKVLIPIHDELGRHLEGLAGDTAEKFVMPHLATLGPGGRHGLSEGFKRIVRRAGLSLDTVQGHGVRKISKRTFHALRHSFTSALANAGVAPELRMKLTGHKTESAHANYTHHELEVLRQAVGKLPSLK